MKKLYRSTTDRYLAGICGGIGEYFHVDATLIRIIFILLLLGTGVFPFGIAYLIAYFMIPQKPHPHIVDEQ